MNPNAARDLAAWHVFRNDAEAGLSLNSNDSGNYYKGELIGSNHGVSAPTLAWWLGRAVTREDMASLTQEQANAIAETMYWAPSGGDRMPSGPNVMVADFSFNAGVGTSVKMLQEILGFTGSAVDGICGAMTILSARGMKAPALIDALHDRQEAHYRALEQPEFLAGWLKRNDARRDLAVKLTGDAA